MGQKNLNVQTLRTFISVARLNSMVAASSEVHLTQSAISQQIKAFETSLNVKLFKRSGRSLELTSNGRALLTKAEEFVRLNDKFWADVQGETSRIHIRLGVTFDLAAIFVSSTLSHFTENHPSVDVSIQCGTTTELKSKLKSNLVDVAIVLEADKPVEGIYLSREQLHWMGSSKTLKEGTRPLQVAFISEECAFRAVVESALDSRNIPWSSFFTDRSFDAARAAVKTGFAITTWLESTARLNPDIQVVDATLPPLPSFNLVLYDGKSCPDAMVKSLTQHLQESLA